MEGSVPSTLGSTQRFDALLALALLVVCALLPARPALAQSAVNPSIAQVFTSGTVLTIARIPRPARSCSPDSSRTSMASRATDWRG
jgi:hypothetical protein